MALNVQTLPRPEVASEVAAAASASALAALADARITLGAREIRIEDRGSEVVYRLGLRGEGQRSGFGWSEAVRPLGDDRAGEPFACPASEPLAVLGDLGLGHLVFELTREGIRELLRCGERHGRRRARVLLSELERGLAGERVALRRLQVAILARLEAGESPAELAERGGFVGARATADTSRFLRRAGLVATPCSGSGKLRYVRTASPEVAAMLCRACDVDPVEVGV